MFFFFAYRFGFKPWDSGIPPPELVEVIEGPGALTAGRALDLGCGTGTNCRYMSQHGWTVTGVDFVSRAIASARSRAPGATLVVGDVTLLDEHGVTGPFDLLLDIGCYHSLRPARRTAYARQAARVARPGALFLLFAFGEEGRGMPAATETEIRSNFGQGFDVIEVRAGAPFRRQTWYRMQRKASEVA